ncbi:hypothetical protein ABIB25_002456 [Nakamurella sp. UYEF19]|uniref:hypothetical protein n=1 Tax=Nakamurella sp. UYEF19 TaxID=1756392 RepID=UPI0033981286
MSTSTMTSDWRFVQLVAGSYLDQGLTQRYAADPRAVLAEFGLELAENEPIPDLDGAAAPTVVNDKLTGIDAAIVPGYCWICWKSQSRPELLAA